MNFAFEEFRSALVRALVLRFPIFSKTLTLTTDASKYRMGEELSQHSEREEHPVAYSSRQLNGAEQKYAATEQECGMGSTPLSVLHLWEVFPGRNQLPILEVADERWQPELPSGSVEHLSHEYDLDIVHRAGK